MNKKCKKCGKRKEIHAKGLCISCYNYTRLRKSKKRYKKQLERSRKWAKRTNYHNKYYHKHIKELRKKYRERDRKKNHIPKSRWRK